MEAPSVTVAPMTSQSTVRPLDPADATLSADIDPASSVSNNNSNVSELESRARCRRINWIISSHPHRSARSQQLSPTLIYSMDRTPSDRQKYWTHESVRSCSPSLHQMTVERLANKNTTYNAVANVIAGGGGANQSKPVRRKRCG
jgi:hypothetical protein